MGLKNTIPSDNRNIKTLISLFPSMGLKKVRLKKTNNSSDSISDEDYANTQSISISRSSLSSSSASRTRRLSSGTHSMRKVNRSQAKRISSGNIISSLQALKGKNCFPSPLDTRVFGPEEKLDGYAISVTSLDEDETSPYKIDITLENLTRIDNVKDLEECANNKVIQLDIINNPVHRGASRIFTEFNISLLFKLMIHVMVYLFVLYIILKKVLG